MAEVAAAALAVEQVVATGIEAAAAVAIAKPAFPLKAALWMVATAEGADRESIARSHHSLTVIGDTAYIFGGEKGDGNLCPIDVLAFTLPQNSTTLTKVSCYADVPLQEASTGARYAPAPRTKHAACARGKYVIIHGGCDADGKPIRESCLWLWDSEGLRWSKIDVVSQIGATLAPRFNHSIFFDEPQDLLVLHGGRVDRDEPQSTETWLFTFDKLAWTQLPTSPAAPLASALVDGTLYAIGSDAALSGCVYILDIKGTEVEREKPGALTWQTVIFPTNPLTPGPTPREGGVLVPASTGLGRRYLIYMFGRKETAEGASGDAFYSDVWSFLPPARGLSAAGVKDAIRDKLPGVDSDERTWAEVELLPMEQAGLEGKAHPGPRGFFAADAASGKCLVLWGGISAKGTEDDGWVLEIQ